MKRTYGFETVDEASECVQYWGSSVLWWDAVRCVVVVDAQLDEIRFYDLFGTAEQ